MAKQIYQCEVCGKIGTEKEIQECEAKHKKADELEKVRGKRFNEVAELLGKFNIDYNTNYKIVPTSKYQEFDDFIFNMFK